MEKNKITFLSEKKLKEKARLNAEFLESQFAQNPISSMSAKFAAFQNVKNKLTIKDLF